MTPIKISKSNVMAKSNVSTDIGRKRLSKRFQETYGRYQKERSEYETSIYSYDIASIEKEKSEYEIAKEQFKEYGTRYADYLGTANPNYSALKKLPSELDTEATQLGEEYAATKEIASGKINLTSEQEKRLSELSGELGSFSTYTGTGDLLYSKPPKYYNAAYAKGYGWIKAPYFEGYYQELDPSTMTVTAKYGKKTGMQVIRSPNFETEIPVLQTTVIADIPYGVKLNEAELFNSEGLKSRAEIENIIKTKPNVLYSSDRKVRAKFLMSQNPKFEPKPDYSDLAAMQQRQQISERITNQRITEYQLGKAATTKDKFVIVTDNMGRNKVKSSIQNQKMVERGIKLYGTIKKQSQYYGRIQAQEQFSREFKSAKANKGFSYDIGSQQKVRQGIKQKIARQNRNPFKL